MIQIAEEPDKLRVTEFLQRKTGIYSPIGFIQTLGFIDSKTRDIKGGWLFERYTGRGGSVHAHWAGQEGKWLTRDMLTMAAVYIFDQLKCEVVFGEVRASDTAVRRIDEKLGFKEVAVLSGYFPDDDLVIYSMIKQDCRWLPRDFKEEDDGTQSA